MKNCFTLSHYRDVFVVFMLFVFGVLGLNAQTANNQVVATQCYTGPTQSFTNTTGTAVGNVTFPIGAGANQIPAGHRIVDVIVEIVWSKSDLNSCTPPTGQAADLSHVGFKLRKVGGPARYLAASAGTAGFTPTPTTSSFSGTFPGSSNGVLFDTISFRDGYPSLLPSGLPAAGNDTVQTNNDSLNFYCGLDPTSAGGQWTIEAIDDAPGAGPALCIHSWCITLVTCDPDTLVASCKANPTVALDGSGTVSFSIADLDSISDVSCLLKSVSFSPATANCSNLGTPLPVTMTFVDHLDSSASCVSNVNVVDTLAPALQDCAPAIWGDLYLNSLGRDTFYADSVVMTDNCGPIIKQVRPFSGGTWGPNVPFNCVTGFQQVWARGIDGQGNIDSCRIVLQIIDTVPPTAVCGVDTTYLSNVANGSVVVNAIDVDGGSFDVCPPVTGRWIGSQFAAPPTYTCADIGADTVRLIVSDLSGNLDTCDNAIIVVIDTTSPTAICQATTVYLNGAGNGTLNASDVDNNSIDTCGIDSVDINGVASLNYDCSHVGTPQPVTLHVFDPSGNTDSCSTTVTVLDTVPPTAICRNVTAYVDGSPGGNVVVVADSLNNNSSDVCTGTNLSFQIAGSPTATYTCADLGSNPVTLTVLDDYGNSATCNATVNIIDTIAPTANCTSPTVYLTPAGTATVNATQLNNTSTDNCTIDNLYINTVGITSTNFNCTAINSPQNVNLIVEDISNNTASCATTVSVVDTVTPTALCEYAYTAQLNAGGSVTVTPSDIDSNSVDNCGLGVSYQINGLSSQTYTCADIGTITAILTVTDSSGNSATCPTNVTVEDNIPPVAACQTSTVSLDASGVAAITPSDVLNGAGTTDNCGTVNATFQGGGSNIIFDCDSIGSRSVIVVVTDGSGNTSTCGTTVTVQDTVDPSASCRATYTVQLDVNGNGFVTPQDINLGSSDVCGIDTFLVNGVDTFFYNCTNVGNTGATLQVIDESGNSETCVTSITVDDPVNPTAQCHDTTLYLDPFGNATAVPSDIDDGSFDNCNLSLTINGGPSINYNCSNLGNNTAFLTADDGSGNTDICAATITIEDTITPTAACTAPGAVSVYVPPGQCFETVPASTFNNGSNDNCAATLSYTIGGLPNVTLTSLGINNITLTVTDGSGNSATCNTTAVLLDTISPTMVCQADTVQLDNNGDALVLPSMINGGSSDNCSSPTLTINGGPSLAVDCADLGSNNVTLTGSDASGNTASCNTTVLVQDLIAPQAQCNATFNLVLDGVTGNATLAPSDIDNNSTDNCTITNYSLSRTNFSCADIPNNTHTVTLTVTDQSGNSSQCNSTVTVVDTVPPNATCVPSLTRSLVGSSVSITPSDVNGAGTTDNCAIQSYSLDQSSFTCADLGANTVTLTVTDSSGNSSTCTSTINIQDNTNPVPSCNPMTVQLTPAGTVTIAATDIATGSFDNCTIDTILVNSADSVTYNCSDLGLNVANIFVQDQSGNSATCNASITVEDNVAPTASCIPAPLTVYLDPNGVATITPTDIDNGSTDNCGTIATYSLSVDSFFCSEIPTSPNNVTLTVTDPSGNSSQCIGQVNVLDTIPPSMSCQAHTVYLSSGGLATVQPSMFDGGTVDACGLASLSYTGAPNPVNCSDVGTHNITLIATDVNGNVDSCQTTLTVSDSVPPSLTCNTIMQSLDATGQLVVDSNTTSLYTASDACGTLTLTFNGDTAVNYNCADIGLNSITIEATDGDGNTASCLATVDVQDNTPPNLTCSASPTQYLDANGQVAVDPNWILTSVVEACGVDTIFATPDTFNCSNIGAANNVTVTVVDSNGNTNTCSANVPITDSIPPTMVCRDTSVCLSGGFANVTAANIDGGTTDACGLSPIMTIDGVNNVIYTCADIGTQVAILERRDQQGNIDTCHANVTVLDCVAPNASCTNFTAQLDSNGQVTVSAIDDINFGSSDDCALDSASFLINNQPTLTYTCATLGSPDTVQFTVADLSGNVDTCEAAITVEDNVNPTARCTSTPINAVLPGSGFFVVPAFNLNNTSTPSDDNCTINSYLINGQAQDSFDCSDLGLNTTVLTVVDGSGNTDTCHALVNVRDLTSPTVNCVFTTNLTLDSTGQNMLPASSLVSTSSDNCGIASITANGQDTVNFTCDSIGSNLMSVIVTDSSGNTASCSAVVNVADNEAPVAICPTNPVPAYLTGAGGGAAYIQANSIDSTSYDNCGIVQYLINGQDSALYTCADIGTLPNAVLTVVDSTGNQNTCNATIQVFDTISPVARCRDITVQLSNSGVVFVNANQIDSFSFDNCNLASVLINGQSVDTFNCSNVGSASNTVLTVIDQYGNSSFCTSNITVLDVTNPTINCPGAPVDVYLNNTTNNGSVIVDPQSVATASDTCSILYWYINGQATDTFNCVDVGTPQLVTISVEDPSGNSASCSAVLNVLDTFPPDANCQNSLNIALDSSGQRTLTWTDIDFFSNDNCALSSTLINGQPSVTYTCDSVQASPLTAVLTLTDPSGNTSSCQSTINLVDNIFPTAVCKDTVFVILDNTPSTSGGGVAIVNANSLDNGSTDACTPLSFLINNLQADTFRCQNVNNPNPRVMTVTDANGNQSTCVTEVQVSDVDPPTVYCQDLEVYLNASGTATVTAGDVDSGSVDNCQIFTRLFNDGSSSTVFSCADTGVNQVTLVVTDIHGNADSCTATVTVRDTTLPTPLCQNASSLVIDLTTNGQVVLTPIDIGTSFDNCGVDSVWLSKDTITCTDIGSIPITYYVTDDNGNQNSCTDTITVDLDRPTASIVTPAVTDTVLCEGQDMHVTATIPPNGIGYSYMWNGPNGQYTFNPNTRDTVVFNVQGSDAGDWIFWMTPNSGNGCSSSDTVNLDVNVVPSPVIASNIPCVGDSVIFSLANASNYSGNNYTFDWFYNGTPYVPNPNDSTLVIASASQANNGLYTMRITVDGCTDSSAVPYAFNVITLPTPPAPFANQPCEGQSLTLFSNPTDSTRFPYTYQWSSNTVPTFNSVLPNPIRPNATQAYAGTYSVTITDPNGCSSDSSVTIGIRPTPAQPDVFFTEPFCMGDILEVQDTTTYTVPPITYTWALPDGSTVTDSVGLLLVQNITPVQGLYSLTVTSAGCESAPDTQSIFYEPVPLAFPDTSFTIEFRDSLIGGNLLNNDVYNTIVGVNLQLVDTTLNGAVSFNTDNTLNYTPNGGFFGQDTFTYSICDQQCPNSCDTAMIIVDVTSDFECFIPNGFSPNGDGVNDQITVRCRHQYPDAVLQVFSRWGTLVYEGPPTGWNGQFNGQDLPDGTYFYVLKLNDTTWTGDSKDADAGRVGDQYTGFFVLQR